MRPTYTKSFLTKNGEAGAWVHSLAVYSSLFMVAAVRHGNKRQRNETPSQLFWFLIGMLLTFLPAGVSSTQAAFVYESSFEFLSSGDFNGDGLPDVLVLDKLTGNARVGYQSPAGALTWSSPLATGAERVSGCGIERFLQTDRDALALTAPDLNRVNLVDLSNTNSVVASSAFSPIGIGPHAVLGLKSATAPPAGGPPYLLVASSFNDAPAERLDLVFYFTGPNFTGLFNETGPFERGNALDLNTNTATFAVGLVRGTNDTLQVWQFTNSGGVLGALSNLPPGSDYAFGRFNNEPLPRFWFYLPGGTNVAIRSLVTNAVGFGFGAPTTLTFTQAVERVYVVGTNSDGSAMIQFGDGIQGVRLPGGSPSLAPKYSTGGGAAGHVTGVAALSDGKFVLLTGPTGSVSSVNAQVMTFNGTNYTQISSNQLSAVTTRTTRATVWLFQNEPFVSSSPNFVASLSAPDWSSFANGLPGTLSVRVETDAGVNTGLGNRATNTYTPPAGAAYGLPDQYRDDISLFSYASVRPPEAVDATIAPPPGVYDSTVTISFTKQHSFDSVLYRLSAAESWLTYAAPFALTHDATIQFYARGPGGPSPARSSLHFASYTLGNTGEPPSPLVQLTNGVATNVPPPFNTNIVVLAASGTVFYSRHTALGELTGFQGPSPYLSFADSLYSSAGFNYFYLENFEDGLLNTPGATPSPGWAVIGPGTYDSVEPGGRSYYSNGSQTNLTITFNAAALGGHLPTHAGILWTDVGAVTSGAFGFGNVRFTARDANGVSLGTNTALNLGNGSSVPFQGEDRFFGVVNRGGISSISITMTNSKDWELDHLQYGYLGDAGFDDAIWTINLDGSGETYVTTGARPRVTPDGHWMAFLRDGGPVTTQGNLWVRDLTSGQETRIFTNTDAITGFDWNWPQTELIFDNNCSFFRKTITGPATPLSAALSPQCFNGAPVVNRVSGQLAFHNVNPSGPQGVYVTPPNWSSRTKIPEQGVQRLRWPAWSPDGSRLVMADRTSSAFINTGVNLWTAAPDGSNLRQITALSEPTNGFPRGAIWKPQGNGLVGAGTIGGTNGLWVIPLAVGGDVCHCPPIRLPTSAGADIDFAGSIVLAPQALVATPGLFIRLEPNAAVVYWSTSYDGFILEYATDLTSKNWTTVNGPYFRAGAYYEYHEARTALAAAKFFRLRYPGIFFLTPLEAVLNFAFDSNQALLSWPADYVGYTLESTTNLNPPTIWTPVPTAYGITNGQFEYRQNLNPGKAREFFRLRWP